MFDLYEFAIIHTPSQRQQEEKGEEASVVATGRVLAKNRDQALAAVQVPKDFLGRIDQLDIKVRVFV